MEHSVFYAKNSSELLYLLKTTQNLSVLGGCSRIETLPQKFISIRSIEELCRIERHERYIDAGPGVTLSNLLQLGEKHLPKVLYDALLSVGNPNIRNIATLGGNILNPDHKLSLYASLLALDAKLELSTQDQSKFVSITNFKGLPENCILSKIRIPINYGDVSVYKRVGPEHSIDENSATFAFIANTEKNSIANISLAFAGPFAFRSREFETSLIGKRIPLTKDDVSEIVMNARNYFTEEAQDIMMNDVMRQQFVNLTRYAFEQLM